MEDSKDLGDMAKILIVEDAKYVGEMIRELLESNGHEIAGVASDGREAIEKYKALRPNIVLMDILMPVMDGISAIRKIKELDPKARIVVVTAVGKESIQAESIKAGALQVVTKPFEPKQLLEAVNAADVT